MAPNLGYGSKAYSIQISSGSYRIVSPFMLPGGNELKFDFRCQATMSNVDIFYWHLLHLHSTVLAPALLRWGDIVITAATVDSPPTLQKLTILPAGVGITNSVVGGVKNLVHLPRARGPAAVRIITAPSTLAAYAKAIQGATKYALACRFLGAESMATLLANHFPSYTSGSDPKYVEDYRHKTITEFTNTHGVELQRQALPPTAIFCSLEALLTEVPSTAEVIKIMLSRASKGQLESCLPILSVLDAVALLGLTTPRKATDVNSYLIEEPGVAIDETLRANLRSYLAKIMQNTFQSGITAPHPIPLDVSTWLSSRAPSLLTRLVDMLVYSTKTDCQAHLDPYSLLPQWPALALRSRRHNTQPPLPCAIGSAQTSNLIKHLVTSPTLFIRSARHRRHLKVLNKMFPAPSLTDNRHQTTHLSSLVWALVHHMGASAPSGLKTPAQRLRRINGALRHIPVGTNQLVVMGFITAVCGLSEGHTVEGMYLKSGALWRQRVAQPIVLKAVGTYVRKTACDLSGHPLSQEAVAQCAYYELLFGRALNVTNWQAEKENRCRHTLHIRSPSLKLKLHPELGLQPAWLSDSDNIDLHSMPRSNDFYSELYKELLDLCKPLVSRRNCREPLSEFIQRRHEWVASGSSAGSRSQISICRGREGKGDKVNEVIKVSKRAWSETLTLANVLEALWDTAPREVAHASEKYENGKARAIYGVEPMHYVINTYATKGFEERLHLVPGLEKGAAGSQACALEMRRALLTHDPNLECTMLDYADFNRHHTPEAQATIFRVFATLGKRLGATNDWIRANEWVADAKRNAWVIFPGSSREERAVQGMFSGTRSTDLINTLLNLAYFNIANKYVSQQIGIYPSALYHVHQGDDVWISNTNLVWARLVYYTLNNMGFIFQEQKQMFGSGRGEYLRVLYQHGIARGYFARAMANYLLRPIQNVNPLDPVAWARAASDSAALLVRRGLSVPVAYAIGWDCRHFWARARAHPKDRAPVSIPDLYLDIPPVQGGVGAPNPGRLPLPSLDYQIPFKPPKMKSSFKPGHITVPTKMTDDWIAYVSNRQRRSGLNDEGYTLDNISRLRDDMIAANYSGDLSKLIPERGWAGYKKDWADIINSGRSANTTVPWSTSPSEAIESITDTYIHTMSWLESGGQVSESARYPYLDAPIQQLLRGEVGISSPAAELTDRLNAIITRSTFKSESTFAKVKSLSRLEAVSLILAEADDLGHGDAELSALIAPILRVSNTEALDLLLGGGGDLLIGLRPFINVGFWQLMQRQWTALLFTQVVTCPNATPLELIKMDTRGTSIWLRAVLSVPPLAEGVLY